MDLGSRASPRDRWTDMRSLAYWLKLLSLFPLWYSSFSSGDRLDSLTTKPEPPSPENGYDNFEKKVHRKHSLNWKRAASVSLKLCINGDERCHFSDAPKRMSES